MSNMLAYAKAVVVAVGGLVTLISAVVADKAVTFDEIELVVAAVGVVVTTVMTYRVPNQPG